MTDNELLLAISEMLDKKLDARLNPIENRIKRIEVDLLESKIIPRLNTIESCYTSTFDRRPTPHLLPEKTQYRASPYFPLFHPVYIDPLPSGPTEKTCPT